MTETLDNLKNNVFQAVRQYYLEKKKGERFVPGVSKIHYAGRVYDEQEMIAAVDSVLDFWLTLGKKGGDFERKLAAYLGVKYAVLVNSGSSANLLAVSALKSDGPRPPLKDGDEVITTALTFPTTLAPIVQHNLVPVFVDVEIPSYNISAGRMKKALSAKTRAVFIAHTLGNPCRMDEIKNFAEEHKLYLIEDCCDALGSEYKGRKLGADADMSTFSFYPAHHITLGEGGAAATNDPALRKTLLSLRSWGKDCFCAAGETNPQGACGKRFDYRLSSLPADYDHKYIYTRLGYNLKPLDIQAAIGLAQMEKLPFFIRRRRENFARLYQGLKRYEQYLILPQSEPEANPCWFAFVVTVKDGGPFSRKDIVAFLEENNIETRMIFAGNALRQPAFKDIPARVAGGLENTDFIMRNSFFIGVYPGLESEHIDYILEKFGQFFGRMD